MRVRHLVSFPDETGVEDHEGGEQDDGKENAVQEDGEGEISIYYTNPRE